MNTVCAHRKHVQAVMSHKTAPARKAALKTLSSEVFGDATFANVKTGIGVITAKWLTERAMIFKGIVHAKVGPVHRLPAVAKLWWKSSSLWRARLSAPRYRPAAEGLPAR